MKAKGKKTNKNSPDADQSSSNPGYDWLIPYVSLLVGIGIACYIGYSYSVYIKLLHENDMWFSNIQQVEREISFRTESGLYFSYFKTMVLAPSISDGIHQLTHDNVTEHLRTINILERFNIYQEVILGICYKLMPISWQSSIEYVYFYLNAIFGLHGFYMIALYLSSWMLSGSFIAGILSNAFFIFSSRFDMTRISFTMPLRESFSLPFIYLQIAVLTYYFRKDIKPSHSKVCLWLITIFTICFTITWQFAQFVLLLQAFSLFGLCALDFVQPCKVLPLFKVILGNLATCCVLQFGNDMLYTSLVSSFSIAAIIVISFNVQSDKQANVFWKLFILIARIFIVLSLMFIINIVIKKITRVDSDDHIYKFVSAKLGYGEATKKDFDALLYLCEGSFKNLPLDTFQRLTEGFVFPVYAAGGGMLLLILATSYIQKLWGNPSKLDDYPELVFHIILSVFFGGMAMTTLRMKFLWMPHMCIVAAGVFFHQDTWKACLKSINFPNTFNFLVRHSVPVLLLSALVMKKLPAANEELSQLREFHDPDTVQLMNWLKSSTPKDSAFTGSMQLMAAVKLSTDRAITNHPHYENKFLRQRTKEVYQIYARREPSEVHKILRRHGTTHIVLENSICFSRQELGCRLIDVLDIDNGHKLNDDSILPRFCSAIKYDDVRFGKYFKKVFENRTFYIYQLL